MQPHSQLHQHHLQVLAVQGQPQDLAALACVCHCLGTRLQEHRSCDTHTTSMLSQHLRALGQRVVRSVVQLLLASGEHLLDKVHHLSYCPVDNNIVTRGRD